MPTPIDYDRELIGETARRHLGVLPVRTVTCLSAAVDELTDPLTLPALVDINDRDTADPVAAITAVRGRLIAATRCAATLTEALAYARAARELLGALEALHGAPARRRA